MTVSLLGLSAACRARRYDITETRTGDADATGVTTATISAGAGWLRIEGNPRATTVRATGIAHASSPAILGRIHLSVTRTGNTIQVTADVPDDAQAIGQAAALDLTIEVPASLALTVRDQSGETIVRNVGPLNIIDEGGGLDIDGVTGDLDIHDGSGELQVADVRGNVRIVDGAGGIYISNVHGSVDIPKDGSGEIQVADVTGSLSIGSKQSGEVAARDVGGNFVVDAKGSGSVEYHGIRGQVTVPQPRR